MKSLVILILLALLLIPAGAHALVMYSGGAVSINDPTDDDVFASGGTVDVNAPIGSLVVAGGTVTINAPVTGDVIAAGGTITANADIGGKLVVAGGTVDVRQDVGTNLVATGGTVRIEPTATVLRDALVSGNTVVNAGHVLGKLSVQSQTFENTGTAGHVNYELQRPNEIFRGFLSVFSVLFTIGLFILGILLLHFLPKRFLAVEKQVRTQPVIRFVVGIVGIIGILFFSLLMMITLVLMPVGILSGLLAMIGLLTSTLFVSSSLGKVIAEKAGWQWKEWQIFTLGFVILNIVYRIPIAGGIVLLVAVSLGFGALVYWVHDNWQMIQGEVPPAPPS